MFQGGEFLKKVNICSNNDGNPKTAVMYALRISASDVV
jgi:hypothetical protein